MPSSTAIAAAQATSTDVVWLGLLTLYIPGATQRFVNNPVEIVSRGQTFTPFPFNFTFPADDGESLPKITLTIQNFDNALIEGIRSITQPLQMKLELVTNVQPDVVEVSVEEMVMRSASYDAIQITGVMNIVNILNRQFPADTYTPVQFPAMF